MPQIDWNISKSGNILIFRQRLGYVSTTTCVYTQMGQTQQSIDIYIVTILYDLLYRYLVLSINSVLYFCNKYTLMLMYPIFLKGVYFQSGDVVVSYDQPIGTALLVNACLLTMWCDWKHVNLCSLPVVSMGVTHIWLSGRFLSRYVLYTVIIMQRQVSGIYSYYVLDVGSSLLVHEFTIFVN